MLKVADFDPLKNDASVDKAQALKVWVLTCAHICPCVAEQATRTTAAWALKEFDDACVAGR